MSHSPTTTPTMGRRLASTGNLRGFLRRRNSASNKNKIFDESSRHKAVSLPPPEPVDDSQHTFATSESSSDEFQEPKHEEQLTATPSSPRRKQVLLPSARPLKSCMSVGSRLDSLDRSGTSSSNKSDDSANKMKKNVSFHKIEIREHPRVLSDNPAVTRGPAIGLGFFERTNELQEYSYDLDEYEQKKPTPRTKNEMLLPSRIREDLLRSEAGVTTSMLTQHQREINKVKHQRRQSSALSEAGDAPQLLVESAKRKLRRFVRKSSKQQEQEELWKRASEYEPQNILVTAQRTESLPTIVTKATPQITNKIIAHEDGPPGDEKTSTDDDDWALSYESE